MSRLALVPINVPALSSAPTVPTLRSGDMYFDTTTSLLMIYNGSTWNASNASGTLSEMDGGTFNGIAPYQGGANPTDTSTQTVNGGTP